MCARRVSTSRASFLLHGRPLAAGFIDQSSDHRHGIITGDEPVPEVLCLFGHGSDSDPDPAPGAVAGERPVSISERNPTVVLEYAGRPTRAAPPRNAERM